jgi:hypothetical protein
VCLALGQGALAGFDHLGRRREVRLSDLEVDHSSSLALHREGPLHDLHGEEGLEQLDSVAESHRAPG